jgi:hypothetical protein
VPSLVREPSQLERPAPSLADREWRSAPGELEAPGWCPRWDAQAAIERERALKDRVGDRENQLEDFAIALLLEERRASASGERVSLDELAAELGPSEFLARERARQASARATGSSIATSQTKERSPSSASSPSANASRRLPPSRRVPDYRQDCAARSSGGRRVAPLNVSRFESSSLGGTRQCAKLELPRFR